MTEFDDQGRPKPPVAADEAGTLLGFLERQRETLAWKCGELDADGLAKTLAPSAITLGGLLKHLAHVEHDMATGWLRGDEPDAPWNTVDWDAAPDWPWRSAADDSPEQLFSIWRDEVAR